MNNPVSIIIPVYNQGKFIRDAIDSVERCEKSLYDLLIVNDGSNDVLTLKVLDELRSDGYKILDQENRGLAEARNRGIREAKSEFILPLDADNKIRPAYLEKSLQIFRTAPQIGVIYGDLEFFGERQGRLNAPEPDPDLLIAYNFIDACAIFRKIVWEDCAGFDSCMPISGFEDWDFWLRAVEANWKFFHIPEILFDYRVRSDSMLQTCRLDPQKMEALHRYVYAKHWTAAQKAILKAYGPQISTNHLAANSKPRWSIKLKRYVKKVLGFFQKSV